MRCLRYIAMTVAIGSCVLVYKSGVTSSISLSSSLAPAIPAVKSQGSDISRPSEDTSSPLLSNKQILAATQPQAHTQVEKEEKDEEKKEEEKEEEKEEKGEKGEKEKEKVKKTPVAAIHESPKRNQVDLPRQNSEDIVRTAEQMVHQLKPFVPCDPGDKARKWAKFCSCNKTMSGLPSRICYFPVLGQILRVAEPNQSTMSQFVARELNDDDYNLRQLILNSGDIILDVGANLGMTSILIAKLNPNVRIVSVEANPGTYKYLSENVLANGLASRITHINRALANKNGMSVSISDCGLKGVAGVRSHIITNHERHPVSSSCFSQSVETATVEKVLEDNHVSSIALLKMDCEGCEVADYN